MVVTSMTAGIVGVGRDGRRRLFGHGGLRPGTSDTDINRPRRTTNSESGFLSDLDHGIQHAMAVLHLNLPRLCSAALHQLPAESQVCRVSACLYRVAAGLKYVVAGALEGTAALSAPGACSAISYRGIYPIFSRGGIGSGRRSIPVMHWLPGCLSFVADIFMKSFSSLEISLWTSVFEIHPQCPHEPTIVTGSIVAGL